MPTQHDRAALPLPTGVQAGSTTEGKPLATGPRAVSTGRRPGNSLPARAAYTRPQPGICRNVAGHPDPTGADSVRRLADLNRPRAMSSLSRGHVPTEGHDRHRRCISHAHMSWRGVFDSISFLYWRFPMNVLILWTALACMPFAPASLAGQNAGCPACECCGCCETGSCGCKSCTCACCAEECPAAGRTAKSEACGSGCCSQ